MRNAALGRRPALGLSNLPRDKTGRRPPQVARIGPITWLNQEAQTLSILYADETGGDQVPGPAFATEGLGLSAAAALPTVLSDRIAMSVTKMANSSIRLEQLSA